MSEVWVFKKSHVDGTKTMRAEVWVLPWTFGRWNWLLEHLKQCGMIQNGVHDVLCSQFSDWTLLGFVSYMN